MRDTASQHGDRGPAVVAQLGRAIGALGALLALGSLTPRAHAAGLYFSERGVRPLARGGAFIAGADDLGAIYYNPAGIYDAGGQFLIDASWLHFTADYTRKSIVEQTNPNTGEVIGRWTKTYPTVQGVTPVLPLPTLAASYRVDPQWVVALGLDAPYGAIPSYPDKIEGQPAPQRYGLLTLDGSLLSVVGLWAAWAPNEQWRVGLGFEALIGRFVATTVLSGCLPDRFLCAYEQPSWDTLAQIAAGPIIAPSANAGVKWIPDPSWRLGLALQLPYWVRAPATMNVRLPATPAFERASLEGVDARVNFETPLGLRVGAEWRPVDELNLELAVSYEAWSMHDQIRVVPDGMALRRVVGLPDPYLLPEVDIPRNFQDTGAVRLGAEYHLDLFEYIWEIRGGLSFESSAVPADSLSVMTVDMPKFTLSGGLALNIGAARFDVTYAHIFGITTEVDPAEANMPLLSPLAANVPVPHTINGGTYAARADVLGIGMRYQFDEAPGWEQDIPASDREAAKPAGAEGER